MECAVPVEEMHLEVPTSSLRMFDDVWEYMGECLRMFETLQNEFHQFFFHVNIVFKCTTVHLVK